MTKIIAFEGIDGTGKGTQMENLAQRLTARGLSVKTISFPIYTSFFGEEVGKLLTGKDGVRADNVDQKSMALWFALDRFEAFRHFAYQDADVLLINRYVLSNAVYQSIRERDLGNPDLLDFVMELEHGHFGLPVPDLYLVLDMAPADASDNVEKKGFREYAGDRKDVYESIPSLQSRARAKYRDYADRMPNIRMISCMDGMNLESISTIGTKIDAIVSMVL